MSEADNKPTLATEDVLAWIRAHPKCLTDHPELLAVLEWPVDSTDRDGTTSLADFQARRLRQQVEKLQGQLKQLSQIAIDNEALMHRLHAVTLSLMSIDSLNEFIAHLAERLKTEFNADIMCLHLSEVPKGLADRPEIVMLDEAQLAWLTDEGPLTRPQCGRFTREKLASLLPVEHTPRCQSAAVLPIGSWGMLTIGAVDQGKFQPHMGTLFLELLASTIAHRLNEVSLQTTDV